MNTLNTLTIVLLISIGYCLDNGLGKTPPMGWNPWNKYGCNISEDIVKSTVEVLLRSGLFDAGYTYLNLDDCWQVSRNTLTNRIQEDPVRFPSGMAALVQYVHSKGLKFGLYSDAGTKTCESRPGSLGYEELDAQTYAEWDIDYLKYDNCFTDGSSPKVRYPPMSAALMQQDKKIYFSMCEWGIEQPWQWAAPIANSWRTTGDISDNWYSFLEILELQVGLENYAGPGQWNDPDMLEVGNGGMTTSEYQAHFALWALLKAPLLIGCDITQMSEETKNILLNKEVIAVNQDALGKQGRRISFNRFSQIWAGEVVDGTVVILFNVAATKQKINLNLADVGITANSVNVRDLINKIDLGTVSKEFSTEVESHSVVMVKFKQQQNEFIIKM